MINAAPLEKWNQDSGREHLYANTCASLLYTSSNLTLIPTLPNRFTFSFFYNEDTEASGIEITDHVRRWHRWDLNTDLYKLKPYALFTMVRKWSNFSLTIARDLLAIHRWASLRKGLLFCFTLEPHGWKITKHSLMRKVTEEDLNHIHSEKWI